MRIEQHAARLADAFDDGGTERDVRHEVTVHHIEMDDVGAGGSGARDLLVETPEIGSQNRRRHENPIGRQFAQVVDHNILFLFFFIQEFNRNS